MSYISEVLADDPYVFYPLNETSGTSAFDIRLRVLGSSTVGTYVGGPVLGAVGLIGTNGAVQTSSASHVVLPFPVDAIGVFFSVELWFQYVSGTAPIFRDNRSTGGWYLDLSGTNPVVGTGGSTARTVTAVASSSLKDSARHHFVITSDGTTYRLYFDGALVDSWSVTGPSSFAYSFLLGKDGANSGHTPGIFAAVAFYGSTLAASRVAAHYAARDQHVAGKVPVTTVGRAVTVTTRGQAGITVTALPIAVSAPAVTRSALVLRSSTTVTVDGPPDAPDPRVEPIHVVSPSVPVPTLVNGVPQ